MKGNLWLILGSSAQQNREMLLKTMLHTSRESAGEVFFFVPEQANLDAERDLCGMQSEDPRGGCVMNIDIVSFRRLAYRLVDELGDRIPPVLDEVGKSLLLKKVMTEHGSEMPLFGGKINKPGFVEEVKSLLSELVSYEITAEALQNAAAASEGEDALLARKLREVSEIYEWFRERCGGTQITEVDIYRAMMPLAEESERLHGSTLFFDGYTGFTPTQQSLLTRLFRRAKDVYVTVTVDPSEAEENDGSSCFRLSREMIGSLRRIAAETDKTVNVLNAEDKSESPAKDPELAHLCRSLFRKRAKVYTGAPTGAVRLVQASDRRAEVTNCVRTIARMIRKEGVRYGEIGIVCGDVPSYAELLRTEMTTAGIPFFIDVTSEVADNALIDYIRSLLRMICTDMRTDWVMRWLRNPINTYDADRLSYLENFLIARGIRGRSMWEKGFYGDYGGKHETHAADCIALAKEIYAKIAGVSEAIRSKDTDVRGKTVALYRFLAEEKVYLRTEALSEELMNESVPWHGRRAREYGSVYRAVTDLFSRMYDLMPDQSIGMKEYADLCDAGFAGLRLGVIPPEPDCVVIGDRKRSRIGAVKHLFFLGMNEGLVPGSKRSSLLLSEGERQLLKESYGIVLSDTEKEAVDTEEFYILLTIQKPTESLTISWSEEAEGGKKASASYIVRRIKKVFRDREAAVANGNAADFFERIAIDGGLEELMQNYAAASGGDTVTPLSTEALSDCRALYRWYFGGESGEEAPVSSELLSEAANGFVREQKLLPELAAALHPAGTVFSVSRMQKYAECPYRHFLEYDLGIEDRQTFAPTQIENGNVYHAMTEFIENRLDEMAAEGTVVTESVLDKLVAEAEEQIKNDPANEAFLVDGRSRYLLHTLTENLHFTLPRMVKRQAMGTYRFGGAEEPFERPIGEYTLKGKIDRVEYAEEDGTRYIKVVDFKSSQRKFDKKAVADGMNLQLPIYLREKERQLSEAGIKAVPAAGFYQSFTQRPVEGLPGEESERMVEANTRPVGFFACENKTLAAESPYQSDRYLKKLDKGLSGGEYVSDAVNLSVNAKGKLSGDGITEAELKDILDTADETLIREASEIAGGNIAVLPYVNDTCKYCDKAGTCRRKAMEYAARRKGSTSEDGGEDE
ncbi:MAG: PD-(D/E)XK nuclease family protein [Lachnospiraceae bacterium]|nr:PD-(D/E)XK nuclease family protein [Lachnospiraceae bacterium]